MKHLYLAVIILASFTLLALTGCKDPIVNSNFLSGTSLKVYNGIDSNDDFFQIHFTENSFYGKTVCNTFSGNYTLDGDKALVSNFTSTNWKEKKDLPNDMLTLFSDHFYFTQEGNIIILKRNHIAIDFLPISDFKTAYCFYDYGSAKPITLDTTQVYIHFKNNQISFLTIENLFKSLNVNIDIPRSNFKLGKGNIALADQLSMPIYLRLLELLNDNSNVKYATVCRNSDHMFASVTNRVIINSTLNADKIKELLDQLHVEKYELIATKMERYITLNNLHYGYEPLYLVNQLSFLEDINYVMVDYLEYIIQ